MNLQNRIEVLTKLGAYIKDKSEKWQQVVTRASISNPWFTEEFIYLAADNIADCFLNSQKLKQWADHYHLDDLIQPRKIGIVMAGNIPMVGFHDLLCVFITGHQQFIKLSSKDNILLHHLIDYLGEIEPEIKQLIIVADQLKGCDAYITTGGQQSATHFEKYFGQYPNIIRRNRTSVAILDGTETNDILQKLSDDIHLFFGLGCRNVTKIYVPENYDFVPLIKSFSHYDYFRNISKYANNYDYQLSMLLMNSIKYMSSESTLLTEEKSFFSPICMLHYEFYNDREKILKTLSSNDSIQCIVGNGEGLISFGNAQQPALLNYADGVDTIQFLLSL